MAHCDAGGGSWFEGNYDDYEADRKRHLGAKADQPHRIKYLDEILRYIMSHDGVWQTTADEIAEYYIANYYDQVVAHTAQFAR